MKPSLKSLICLLLCSSIHLAAARTWTNDKGKTIEAEIVSATEDQVVLKFKGREVTIALNTLSQADQDFVGEWRKSSAEEPKAEKTENVGTISLNGTELAPNKVTTVMVPMSEDTLKTFKKAKIDADQVKIAIGVPEGFNPAAMNRVFWVSAAINPPKDADRKKGNTGSIGAYAKTAMDAGWVVIAVDSNLGNPREEDNLINKNHADLDLHLNAVEILSKEWPEFKNWEFACGGNSGGSKASYYRVGGLIKAELKVVGLFLGGCNEDRTEDAREEVRHSKSKLRKVNVWISTGKNDTIAPKSYADKIYKALKSGYGEVRLEMFEGGHGMNKDELKKALKWFEEQKG